MVGSLMRAIPLTARERIIHLYDQGQSTREIAEFLGFCVAAVRRVRQQFKVRGSLKPQTHLCGRKTLLTAERKASLQKRVQAQPDATLAELGARWDRPFGTSTVDLWVRRLGLTYKKTLFAAEQNRPDGAEKRAHWHEQLAGDPVGRLVFVDESGANTQMTRLRGRSPLGQRLVARIPLGHYQTTTLISVIRLTGPTASWLFDGAMDGEMFLAWIRQGLVPVLHRDDLVILDNLPTHKVAGARQAIEEAGARLRYLPPYSPDYNPIENRWSKIKQMPRSLAPRTPEEMLQAAKTAHAAVTAADCQGFFLNARHAA